MPQLPDVVFESGWLLDSQLADISKQDINQNAVDEIASRVSEFQSAWNSLGRPLLKVAIEESGLLFKEKDIKGFLICGPIFSQSHPLIVNAKYFLSSMEREPRPISEFVEVVFHELLHILLQDNVRSFPTPVLQDFIEDGFDVLAHLHLMAIQKHSHEKLGNPTDRLSQWYGKMGEGYERSWQVVSDEVIFSKLINEIGTEFGNSQ